MKIVIFTRSCDFNGRHYARGERRELSDEAAEQLIADGGAQEYSEELATEAAIILEQKPAPIVEEKPRRGKGRKS